LSVYVNESQDHTKAILKGSALSKVSPVSIGDANIVAIREAWHKFDEWIAMHPNHMVSIPFFSSIVDALEHMPVRFRRDIPHGLSGLIKASALIHCATREVNKEGHVIANLDDYDNAREAIEASLSLAADPAETPACTMILNWVIKKIGGLTPDGKGILKVTSRDIAQDLGVNQSTVSRHIASLIKSSQLKNKEMNKGRPYQLQLGSAMSHATGGILPTKEQVSELLRKS
jgi:DNA-binding transcriptional ArsR family regulator